MVLLVVHIKYRYDIHYNKYVTKLYRSGVLAAIKVKLVKAFGYLLDEYFESRFATIAEQFPLRVSSTMIQCRSSTCCNVCIRRVRSASCSDR